MADYAGIIDFVARRIVRKPDELAVRLLDEGRQTVVEISCAQEDMGKLIGKGGRNIDAIRAVGRAAGLRNGERVQVELAEDEDERTARIGAREQAGGGGEG
ncbi:MAG: hypothetical protein NVSMB29_19040 [Candidatus Dormibacteria bacterium]